MFISFSSTFMIVFGIRIVISPKRLTAATVFMSATRNSMQVVKNFLFVV